MHPDGRLEYVGYETFGGVLDYPVSAHPVRDGNDLLFHSYSVDEEVGARLLHTFNDSCSNPHENSDCCFLF
jgi:hypothetical protein